MKVMYVCCSYDKPEHVFTKEEDAQNWCLDKHRSNYGSFWPIARQGSHMTEEEFIDFLKSGNEPPFTIHDIDCD